MRHRVLLVHPRVTPDGGGIAVASWFLQALKDAFRVTLFTLTDPPLDRVNAFYGTSLYPGDFDVMVAPGCERLVNLLPVRAKLLEISLLFRAARNHLAHHAYDAVISTANETDFGRQAGIQYIHYPWDLLPRPDVDFRWYHKGHVPLWVYRRLCTTLSGKRDAGVCRNLTLVNSAYIGEKMRLRYGVESQTLFPPVHVNGPFLPWAKRQDGFVCIGRIVPEKELLKVIEIIERLQRRHPQITLHIVGATYPGEYLRRVREAASKRHFVQLHEDASRAKRDQLIAENRFGVHGMVGEHFGIAVAELVKGGCIPFVPDVGGPVEIVGDHPALQYRTIDEAVDKMDQTLMSQHLQQQLVSHLALQQPQFRSDVFTTRVREVVHAWIKQRAIAV